MMKPILLACRTGTLEGSLDREGGSLYMKKILWKNPGGNRDNLDYDNLDYDNLDYDNLAWYVVIFWNVVDAVVSCEGPYGWRMFF
jgi:hypothetical protein